MEISLYFRKHASGGAGRKRRRGTGLSARRSRTATGEWRIVVPIALFSALLAGCTTSAENSFGLTNPSFTAASAGVVAGENAAPPAVNGEVPEAATVDAAAAASGATAPTATVMDAGDTALPTVVAYVPTTNPVSGSVFPPVPVMADANAASKAAVEEISADEDAAVGAAKPAGQQVASAATAPAPQFFLSAGDPAPQPAPPKKRGFLSNLFSTAEAAPMKTGVAPAVAPRTQPEKPAEPLVQLASVDPDEEKPARASLGGGNDLPGVRKTALFEIKRKSGLDDDSDVDLHEEDELGGSAPSYQVASAAGLARLAPNGLLKQTDSVDVACLKPTLVRVLKAVEAHYGRKMTVTSGYRSPTHNRRVRGAKNSMHMYCAAADVQVPGVTKWELAAFVRSMPGRGGVGTYCHTESVHIDVGPERDWNWRCRGKRKKRA